METVALGLAQGAMQYIGNRLMASVFGDPTIRDVKNWIDSAVKEIERFISLELRSQLTEQYLKEISDAIGGAVRNLIDYDTTKDLAILIAQFEKVNTLIQATKRYGQPTIFLFANIISIRLVILAALVKNHNKTKYLPLINTTVAEAQAHIESIILQNRGWLDAGYVSVTPCQDIRDIRFLFGYTFSFTSRAGRENFQSEHYQTAEGACATARNIRIELYRQEYQAAVREMHDPLMKIVDLWKQTSVVTSTRAG